MGILFSSDFHMNKNNRLQDITRDSLKHNFKDFYNDINYHIMLGDTGFLQTGKKSADHKFFEVLAKRPFPVLSILGDDDPIYGKLNDISEVDIGIGEKVLKISDNPFIAYLKRGKIYFIDGIKILVLGGALSLDIEKRKREKRWWKNEYWSDKEKEDLYYLLENNNQFDMVLSHTGPYFSNMNIIRKHPEHKNSENDEVAMLNEKIYFKIYFRLWLCGHWHYDEIYITEDKENVFFYMHKYPILIDKEEKKIINRTSHLKYKIYEALYDKTECLPIDEEIQRIIDKIGSI